MKLIAGVDIGFRNTGIVVAQPKREDPGIDVIAWNTIKTKSTSGKDNLYQASRDIRDCELVLRGLKAFLAPYSVRAIIAECPASGAKSATAMRAMGMATALTAAFAIMVDIPFVYMVPTQIRKEFLGKAISSKEESQDKVLNMFPNLGLHKTKDEHVLDALAALVASRATPVVLAVLGSDE